MSINKVCINWAWKDIHVCASFLGSRGAPEVGSSTVGGAQSTGEIGRCLTLIPSHLLYWWNF
jgi:hypothetical protein